MDTLSVLLHNMHVVVTEACNDFGTKIALCLAQQGMNVTCVSSIEKSIGGLRCGTETPGVSKLFESNFYHIPVINLRTLSQLADRIGRLVPLDAIVVVDPRKGSKHALKNAHQWSKVFSPMLQKSAGILACCPFTQKKDIGVWHTFLKNKYQESNAPQHNVVCFGPQPQQTTHCEVLESGTTPTFLNALFANRPGNTNVSLMRRKE